MIFDVKYNATHFYHKKRILLSPDEPLPYAGAAISPSYHPRYRTHGGAGSLTFCMTNLPLTLTNLQLD